MGCRRHKTMSGFSHLQRVLSESEASEEKGPSSCVVWIALREKQEGCNGVAIANTKITCTKTGGMFGALST